jgi:hypothetical protein
VQVDTRKIDSMDILRDTIMTMICRGAIEIRSRLIKESTTAAHPQLMLPTLEL